MYATANDATGKPCRLCGADIHKDATYCSRCNHYQSPWRNEAKYWASTAALISLLVSGAAFSVNTIWDLLQRFFRLDIVVSALNVFGQSAIWNASQYDIMIEGVSITSGDYSLRWDVHEIVKPTDVLRIELMSLTKEQWTGPSQELYGVEPSSYLDNLTADRIEAVKNGTAADLVISFLQADGQEYLQQKRNFGETLPEIPCEATVYYVVQVGGSLSPATCFVHRPCPLTKTASSADPSKFGLTLMPDSEWDRP